MKDYQKTWKPDCTNSVIAMLMGLDGPRPQPAIHEKRAGLSESYLRKAASIGLRQGSLVSVGRSCGKSTDLVAGVQASRSENADTSHKVVNSITCSVCKGTRNSKTAAPDSSSSLRGSYESRKSIGKNDEHRPRHVLRCQKKLNRDSLSHCVLGIESIDSMRKSLNSGDMDRKTGVCNPTNLLSRNSGPSNSSVLSSIDSVDDESLPVSEFEAVKDSQYEPNAVENKFEMQTTSQKDVLEPNVGRGSERFQTSSLDETMSLDSKVSELSSCSFSCFGSTFKDPEAYILVRDEMDGSFENDTAKEFEPSATFKISSRNYGDAVESESNHGALLEVEVVQPSSGEEVFSREASLNEYIVDESAYSNFSTIVHPESLENLKRTNQHSPNSVLESFDVNDPSLGCFDSAGLRLKLESLKSEAEETYSEGSVRVVSGDENSQEQFGDLSRESRKVMRWQSDGESRNFSYMVDVLDAVFLGINSCMDLEMWYSLQCPINPSVFDALEKKYGKQKSWPKLERQLLFDRINSGLVEIFSPAINFPAGATSVRRRFNASFRHDEVVDELWLKLVKEEKEKSKDPGEKGLEKWLELEEGIDIICRELETSLFDELAMEYASLWD